MHTPRGLSAFFLLLLLLVSSALYYPRYFAAQQKASELAAALSASSSPAVTTIDERTKAAGCAVRGPLPDHECTPGAIFPEAAPAHMCVPGYTKTVRDVSTKLRKEVFAEYNIAYPEPYGSYEVDHLIPLAIGGSNDIANLFPEAASPKPGFREKDLVEVFLQGEVCAGRADLKVAQAAIANDWMSIYEKLTPETIAALKAKYHNWSN